MFGKAVLALLVIVGLLTCGTRSASALTFYTNEGDWLAAVSGDNIAPYPYNVTRTDYLTTVELTYPEGYCCVVLGHSTVTTATSFESFRANFSFRALDICQGELDCIVTAPSEVLLTFNTPIAGFAAVDHSVFSMPGDNITVNGEDAPIYGMGEAFVGVVGPISNLDFVSSGGFTDDQELLDLQDIVVATVDEPPTLASLAFGLVLLALIGVTDDDDRRRGFGKARRETCGRYWSAGRKLYFPLLVFAEHRPPLVRNLTVVKTGRTCSWRYSRRRILSGSKSVPN